MNQFVATLQYYIPRFGPVEEWDELYISHLLNETPVGAKVWAKKNKTPYFMPKDAMLKLISVLKD
jgi:hypothetical protein